ncbi:FGGY-family carbohydrate kinase [Devosia sp. MC1541]|uniref:FGGY family pentulose kinase n=1 Tax=Devosia sp. MC1541 TaxID=2725264 RepID=UPI00145EB02F
MSQDLLIGVDVGTGSARAGLFDKAGKLLSRHEVPISMRRSDAHHAEHDSEEIWSSVCQAVRAILNHAKADPAAVVGIAFDATCSLVVRDADGVPVTVSPDGNARWDTIVWLDHRAIAEAEECTRTGHRVLSSIGGVMSPEMEVPKLMWLKRHLPQSWSRAKQIFDLADFLSWKATGSNQRSLCTLATKWTYQSGDGAGWQHDFFEQIGLEDIVDRTSIPPHPTPVGGDLGPLTSKAATELGLTTKCHVGAGVVDAYSGALATLGPLTSTPLDLNRHCALIAGTSSCVMTMAPDFAPTPGVWGPHHGTILGGYWQMEGGQSASGALLDHIVHWHAAGGDPTAERHRDIIDRVQQLRAIEGVDFAKRLHVVPDFHGNRSPLANPNALGVISGLTLDSDFDSLCRLYWRTCVGIALGIRHILDAINTGPYAIETIHVIGGHTKNSLLMELYAEATGCTVIEPNTPDATLLGMAMAAANAAGLYDGLAQATIAMHQAGTAHTPHRNDETAFSRDYDIFLKMLAHRAELDAYA